MTIGPITIREWKFVDRCWRPEPGRLWTRILPSCAVVGPPTVGGPFTNIPEGVDGPTVVISREAWLAHRERQAKYAADLADRAVADSTYAERAQRAAEDCYRPGRILVSVEVR